jgi:hypothetical protein
MLRCQDPAINFHDQGHRNMVSIHDLGVDVVIYPSFARVRGDAIPFQVQLLSNKILYILKPTC